jgi:hypothetical protein
MANGGINERSGASSDVDELRALNQRLRAAFVAGAERHSRRQRGRGLTEEALRRVLAKDPRDLSAQYVSVTPSAPQSPPATPLGLRSGFDGL